MNSYGSSGQLSPHWKTADIRFIPNLDKSPHLNNLRPTSLTACVGKLVVRLLLKLAQSFLKNKHLIPNTMYGFRKHVSTQEILLQIKEELLAPATFHSPRAVLALDLKGVFDVSHSSILYRLKETGCGCRTNSYIVEFLPRRHTIIRVGDVQSQCIALGDGGTPQRFILSPLLFILTLLDLPLNSTPPQTFTTRFTPMTSQYKLTLLHRKHPNSCQRATDVANRYASLVASVQKSELLVVRKHPPASYTEPIVSTSTAIPSISALTSDFSPNHSCQHT